jgi:hypothetical protein
MKRRSVFLLLAALVCAIAAFGDEKSTAAEQRPSPTPSPTPTAVAEPSSYPSPRKTPNLGFKPGAQVAGRNAPDSTLYISQDGLDHYSIFHAALGDQGHYPGYYILTKDDEVVQFSGTVTTQAAPAGDDEDYGPELFHSGYGLRSSYYWLIPAHGYIVHRLDFRGTRCLIYPRDRRSGLKFILTSHPVKLGMLGISFPFCKGAQHP